jgi:hypothetical protein
MLLVWSLPLTHPSLPRLFPLLLFLLFLFRRRCRAGPNILWCVITRVRIFRLLILHMQHHVIEPKFDPRFYRKRFVNLGIMVP